MRVHSVLRAAVAVLILSPFASTPARSDPDDTELTRSIGEEPKYEAEEQHYALLVLGPKASSKVWFVVDGRDLYVDRNADGDLVDEGEKITAELPSGSRSVLVRGEAKWQIPSLSVSERYTDIQVRFAILNKSWRPSATASNRRRMRAFMLAAADVPNAQLNNISVTIDGSREQQTCNTAFGSSPASAPIFRMDAPLTLGLIESFVAFELWKEDEDQDLTLAVGNVGIGPGSFSYITYDELPDAFRPTVTITFPGKDGAAALASRPLEMPDRC